MWFSDVLCWFRCVDDPCWQVELLGLILMHPRPPLDPERDGVDERGYFSPLDGGYGGDGASPPASHWRGHAAKRLCSRASPMIARRPRPGPTDTLPKLAVKTTLIVSPSSILYQWRDEIRLHTPQLSVYIYEGAKKDANISAEEVRPALTRLAAGGRPAVHTSHAQGNGRASCVSLGSTTSS